MAVPALAWGLVDVGDVEASNTDSITVWSRHNVSRLCYVTADICSPAMFSMKGVADEVEALDAEPVSLVNADMRLLEADDVNLFGM